MFPVKIFGFISNIQDELIDFRDDNKDKIQSATDYIAKNPDKIILGISLIASLLRASQSLVVSHRAYTTRKRAERSYYDSHTHTKWTLTRGLTNFEKKVLNSRVKSGESAVDILEEMGVLK